VLDDVHDGAFGDVPTIDPASMVDRFGDHVRNMVFHDSAHTRVISFLKQSSLDHSSLLLPMSMTPDIQSKPMSNDWVDVVFHGAVFPPSLDAKRLPKPGPGDDATPTQGTKRKANDDIEFTAMDGKKYKKLKYNTFPFWSSGMEYLLSCVRRNSTFYPDQAREADAFADILFEDCYGCTFFEASIKNVQEDMDSDIEACHEDEDDDMDAPVIMARCRAYLAKQVPQPLDKREGGLDYARFCGESGLPFDEATARAADAKIKMASPTECYHCYYLRARLQWLDKQAVTVKMMIRTFYENLQKEQMQVFVLDM